MKQCMTCREWHSGDRDSWYQKYRDQEHETVKNRKHRVREEAREYVHTYLSTHPCAVCGESDPDVLEFHHTGGKGWILSNLVGGGNALAALQAEIATCIVLCTNCHKRVSKDELSRFRSKK